jgi:outer membrane protein OmpA-like peptidoglycan-associated protein
MVMGIHSRRQWGAAAIARFSIAVVSVVLLLSGCYHRFLEEDVPTKCPEVISDNIILCPSPKVCTPAANRQIMCALRHQAVQVNRVGEDMQLIIASDRLFQPNSANFKPEYVPVLKAVGILLQCYNKVDVRIEGYTDCCGCEDRNEKLSLTQANTVSKYLWEHGTDSRLLYTKGFGRLNPIANSDNYYGRARNRRIEILFRDHPHWD